MLTIRAIAAVAGIGIALAAPAARAEQVRIAFIESLSGPFAPVGQNLLRSWQSMAELANTGKWAGQHTFEVTGYDSKGSPQETLILLQSAIDKGYRYISQGSSSAVGLALIDAIEKHNQRNPGKEVVYLNYGASDPDMTNARCSFWHFRFDANSDMKLEALTSYMAARKEISKVYIIGQNYSFGHQVARAAREYLKQKRPDVQIVGDDLHPIGQVKDFAPYIAKIKASGADTVITGNWGADLALLIKAGKEADLKANFYTLYAGTTGVPTAIGAAGEGRMRTVAYWHANNETYSGAEIVAAFRKKHNDDFYGIATYTATAMLAKAIREGGSTDPLKVAQRMSGMKMESLNGEVEMRRADHQLQQPLYVASWHKVDGKEVRFGREDTGYGWKTEKKIASDVASQPTSCQMKRPE
ncbi:branched-chain amino acid ABC transporter substrate-binding protein [Janthinobacterium sp. 17J80-10]|uniref:branched-chain amino acid ABC transporter substrate-binding protein n=1 Tax=Janthinobacterium sp. 17J80-10 TaxID=2497863 RepID=UPI001005A8E3|nr:branched-chain amino acid ABC transporter substrate-binding protein [Janthinobacterium sp. 17J80-10]QAU34424.1 branched-chain amino acid ABC transporter substrate-binding protein [Janthinobacterium sp. 17J80-10]